MNYIRTATYTAIILLLCTYVSFAQETKPNFKVRIAIDAVDENTKTTAESYLSRELRSRGDVTIVDKDQDCLLWIKINGLKYISSNETLWGADDIVSGIAATCYISMYWAINKTTQYGYKFAFKGGRFKVC